MSRDRSRRGEGDASTSAAASVAPGKRTLTEGLTVQRKATRAVSTGDVRETAAAGVADSSGALPHLDRIQASFGGEHELASVRAGVGGEAGQAAARIGAEAYAMGDRVAFQQTPDLHTAAHEAAHVVQQRSGVAPAGGVGHDGDQHEQQADAIADRVVAGAPAGDLLPGGAAGAAAVAVQLRRVPGNVAPLVDHAQGGGEPANALAHRKGLQLVIDRAELSLRSRDANNGTELFKKYMKEALDGLPNDEVVDPGELLVRKSRALTHVAPDLAYGDPAQQEIGARRGTDDARNLRKLVHNAKVKVFDVIASGSVDSDLADVFGHEHVALAKRKYVRARRELQRLLADDEIHTDRSGFSGEVNLGGYALYQGPIMLEPNAIDAPDEAESIRVVIHESMHAGNPEIDDNGNYPESGKAFIGESAHVKLTNAAHFEVVPRRILGFEPSFKGVQFIPAGTTTSGGVSAAPLDETMQAQRQLATELRTAWGNAIDLYGLLREVRLDPRLWTHRIDHKRYSQVLRYWSKVLKLTIHEKTDVDPRSHDPARLPVSDIDMALAEGVTRRLRNAKGVLPGTEPDLEAFEKELSTDAERTAAHASVDEHRDFLKRLVLGLPSVGPITGSIDRDMGVLTELGTRSWDQIVNPSAAEPPGPEHAADDGEHD